MAANFPNSPNINDTFTSNGVTFTWNGEAWKQPASPGVKGTKGDKGTKGQKGDKGDKGDKGQKGEIGLSGNPGGDGTKGQKGDTGAGDKGQKGQGGNDGNDGTDGDKGDKGQKGTDGNDGTGIKGNKGEPGADGSDGTSVKGDKGQKGDSVKGQKGEVGADGNDGTGIKGNKGEEGSFGGATFEYKFNDSTTDADPGAGKLALNNGAVSSATRMYIDDTDGGATNTNIEAFLRTIDDSTSTIKGHVRISNKSNADDFAMFSITGASVETVGYHKVVLTHISGDCAGAGIFTNNEDLIVTFARTGNIGDKGQKGDSVKGQKGQDGNDGTGVKGNKGEPGASVKGEPGASVKGNKGEPGADGSDGSDGTSVKGNKGEPGASVKGNKGEPGADGSDGSDGTSVKGQKGEPSTVKGQKGEPGADGTDGSDGTSVKGQKGEPSTVKGQKGEPGADGTDGSDGTSVKGDKGDFQKGQKGDTGSANTTQAATVKVRTDNGNAFHNIVFVDSLTDDQFQIVKMDDENHRLQWNPSTEVLKAYRKQSYQVLDWTSGSTGSAGQVLTSQGSSAAWTWTTPSTGNTTTINNNANNRLITGSNTANTLEGESNLTFDGSTLEVTGSGTPTIESASNLDVNATSTKFSGTASFAGGHPTSNFYSKADDLVVANFTQDTGISIFSGTSNQATISFGSTTFGTGALEARLFYDSSTDDFIMQTQTAQHHIKLQSAGAIELGSSNDVIMTIEDPDLAASHGVEVSGTIYPKAPVGNLGLSGVRWNNIYGNYLHGDGASITNIPYSALTGTPSIPSIPASRPAKSIFAHNYSETTYSGTSYYSGNWGNHLSATFTPSNSNNRVVVMASFSIRRGGSSNNNRYARARLSGGGDLRNIEIVQTNSGWDDFKLIAYDAAGNTSSRTYYLQINYTSTSSSNADAQIRNASIVAIELSSS